MILKRVWSPEGTLRYTGECDGLKIEANTDKKNHDMLNTMVFDGDNYIMFVVPLMIFCEKTVKDCVEKFKFAWENEINDI